MFHSYMATRNITKRDRNNSVSFNISITLILNAWVGIHPTTQMCLIFQRAFSHLCYKNN